MENGTVASSPDVKKPFTTRTSEILALLYEHGLARVLVAFGIVVTSYTVWADKIEPLILVFAVVMIVAGVLVRIFEMSSHILSGRSIGLKCGYCGHALGGNVPNSWPAYTMCPDCGKISVLV